MCHWCFVNSGRLSVELRRKRGSGCLLRWRKALELWYGASGVVLAPAGRKGTVSTVRLWYPLTVSSFSRRPMSWLADTC